MPPHAVTLIVYAVAAEIEKTAQSYFATERKDAAKSDDAAARCAVLDAQEHTMLNSRRNSVLRCSPFSRHVHPLIVCWFQLRKATAQRKTSVHPASTA